MGKGKKGVGANSAADDAATKHEQPLQAVLLADSFTQDFRPLSLDRPKVLSPLNNVKMIDYAMDFLAGAGVEEVFVVCVSEQVEEYLEQEHTTSSAQHTDMQVSVIKDSSLTNAGDALREIDKRNLVQSDPFVLMFGDVITNVDIKGVLEAHKERHKRDSSAIMTLLMKQVGSTDFCNGQLLHSSIRTNTEDLVVAIDPAHDNRVLVYDDHNSKKSVALPCSFFSSHAQIDLRSDLLDCGIDICSPDVLARMADEFDYRDIRREFVANSVAEEEEGLQNKIFAHIIKPTEYAARIRDFATYHAVSKEMLRRWCYPVVPDILPSGYEKQYRYTLGRHYLYQERNDGKTRIGRSSKVHGPGMIGSSCFIGESCRIEGTVLGNFCRINDNATVIGSHLWDSVEVGHGATVLQSILSDGCLVKAGAVINRGCIIGAGCVVGEGCIIPEFTRLTLKEEADDDFDDDWGDDGEDSAKSDDASGDENLSSQRESELVSNKDLVGLDGKGRKWEASPEDDDDDDENSAENFSEVTKSKCIGFNPERMLRERLIRQEEESDDFSEDEDDMEIMDTDLDKYEDGAVTFVDASAPITPTSIIGRQKGVDVVKELKIICLEYETTSPIENLAIELNSFKFSQNASYSDCTMAATLSILERMDIRKGSSDGKVVSEFKSHLEHWAPLLRKMSIGLDEEKAIIAALERCALMENEMGEYLSTGASFRFLLQTLHDEEIVSEDAILAWAMDRRNQAEDDRESALSKLFLLKPVQDFLEWLEEESEEESDDEDESEEDD